MMVSGSLAQWKGFGSVFGLGDEDEAVDGFLE
jgi:hypothetical protein